MDTVTDTIPEPSLTSSSIDLYLDVMKRILINHIYQDHSRSWVNNNMDASYEIIERISGEDHPHCAHTMIGWKRLNNIETCFRVIVEDGIPGDLIETGVWRGGAVIFMRALLSAFGDRNRRVWVADSFSGVPAPNPAISDDNFSNLHELAHLRVCAEEVRENFRRYGLLDDQVVFLEGLFQETLPRAKLPTFSLIRLDGDLYESTSVSLNYLYPKLSHGGFVIIDDYFTFEACKKAVDEYRSRFEISAPIIRIDRNAVFWRKTS